MPPLSFRKIGREDESLKRGFCFVLHMEIDGFTEKSSSAIEENGNALFAEDFEVEDLLDLRGLPEPEKDDEEVDVAGKGVDFYAFEKEDSFQLPEIGLPEETEAADLEWVSRFVHDCHSEYPPAFAGMTEKRTVCFPMKKTPLLSSAVFNLKRRTLIPIKSKRSKRHRRVGGFWSLPGTSPVSSVTTAAISSSSPSCSCSSSSSYLFYEPLPAPSNIYMPKKRGRKPKISAASCASGERRCSHCGVQKTPQWRAGPHGPKTLCNACGVRFKSGRLLPEYRPACSPTFVRSVHSNSHRKVLEMRRKKEVQLFSASAPPLQSC
ncbi:GATA transcription factor 5 [Platanthera guangdongensis]|uniref:GATA transcription factor 5 n=1 Tax=Platanthera guangdongensis TaxID=2320717 RepID=A0ABR2LNK9_9ASPA